MACLGGTFRRWDVIRYISRMPDSPTIRARIAPDRLSEESALAAASESSSACCSSDGADSEALGEIDAAAIGTADGDSEAFGLAVVEAAGEDDALVDGDALAEGLGDDFLTAADGEGFAAVLAAAAAGGGATGAGGGGGGGAGAGGGGAGGALSEPPQPAAGPELPPATCGSAWGVDLSGEELPPNSTTAIT